MPEIISTANTDELDILIKEALLDDIDQEEFNVDELDALEETSVNDEEVSAIIDNDIEWNMAIQQITFEHTLEADEAAHTLFNKERLRLSSNLNAYFMKSVSPNSTSMALSPEQLVKPKTLKSTVSSILEHPARITLRTKKRDNQSTIKNNTSTVFGNNSDTKKRKYFFAPVITDSINAQRR